MLVYIRATATQSEVLHASTIDILPVSITTDFLFLQLCGVRYVSCENGVMGLGKVSFGMSYYYAPINVVHFLGLQGDSSPSSTSSLLC